MTNYVDTFLNAYSGYASYLWNEIINPTWKSYFWWLIVLSLFFFVLEVIIPWRKKQKVLRQDFWLDVFYMFFNFFLFSLVIYNAASEVVVTLFNDSILWLSGGFNLKESNPISEWPMWAILILGFFVRDFIQWWIHRLLHRSDRLWEFHKVHHSVQQMGFAAHLRYHWMENIVYRTLEYIPLALLGITIQDFFIIHLFTLAWGHFNHSNISVSGKVTGGIVGALIGIVIAGGFFDVHLIQQPSYSMMFIIIALGAIIGSLVMGPFMKKIFNSPEMHIWHHTENLPSDRYYGVNFGLTLACWDYIFGTAYVPEEGRNNKLGFPGVENYPKSFKEQNLSGF